MEKKFFTLIRAGSGTTILYPCATGLSAQKYSLSLKLMHGSVEGFYGIGNCLLFLPQKVRRRNRRFSSSSYSSLMCVNRLCPTILPGSDLRWKQAKPVGTTRHLPAPVSGSADATAVAQVRTTADRHDEPYMINDTVVILHDRAVYFLY
ncbi:MAG: hypothetical protein MZV70_23620 [Desulfobacterales bacterium]|nr:hypothetical protein [Desulfobacterales bacterium]